MLLNTSSTSRRRARTCSSRCCIRTQRSVPRPRKPSSTSGSSATAKSSASSSTSTKSSAQPSKMSPTSTRTTCSSNSPPRTSHSLPPSSWATRPSTRTRSLSGRRASYRVESSTRRTSKRMRAITYRLPGFRKTEGTHSLYPIRRMRARKVLSRKVESKGWTISRNLTNAAFLHLASVSATFKR